MKRRHPTSEPVSVRELNLSTVLRSLQISSTMSRAGLANLTGLNKTTISSLVEELLERRLVHEIGLDTSGGGRPARLLQLNPQAGCIIGVELGVDFVSVILTDFVGQIIWQRTLETDPNQPQDGIIKHALHLVDEARSINQSNNARLLGIGLIVPGMVDVKRGVLLFSPNLQWRNVALCQIFREYTNLPVYVENDANAAALGEHFFGVARQIHNFIFLTLGIGVGGGLFLDGDLYRGAGGIAGEIGHTNLLLEGNRPCHCGNRGCWETVSNQYALIEQVNALLNVGRSSIISNLVATQSTPLSLSIIAQAAESNDQVALEALTHTAEAIGLGISNLINIFNPEMIVIGGTMSTLGDYLLPVISQTVEKHALKEARSQTRIILSAFGAAANVIGAIALVFKDVLLHPSRIEYVSW